MTGKYEPPEEIVELTKEDIHKRYQDTAMTIFKDQQKKQEVTNYLTFGNSRRTIEYSNYGNQPVILRRPPGIPQFGSDEVTARMLRLYQKPRENCIIS